MTDEELKALVAEQRDNPRPADRTGRVRDGFEIVPPGGGFESRAFGMRGVK